MTTRREFLALTAAAGLAAPATAAPTGTMLYVAGLPNRLITLDEAQEKIVDQVTLPTGVGRGLVLSADRSKIYLNTWPRTGIEVFDRNTGKMVNSFKLDDETRRFWIRGFAVDAQDKFLYTVAAVRTKLADRFDVSLPKFLVVDIAQQKVVRMVDYPKEETHSFASGGGLKLSPDGKYLYQFRDKLLIFDTTDFKLVQKIELSRPEEFAEMENISVTVGDDPHDQPGMMTAIFNSTDPIIHNRVFGIAQVNLATRDVNFTPIGPQTTFMTGLKLSPDRKTGYLVAYRDILGNRRTEFWVFDLTTKKLTNTVDFPGPTQIRVTLSGNGRSIFIYGSAPMMDVYDSATLKIKKTLDMNSDLSSTILVVPPTP
jgi:hypothetical protein